MTQISMGRIPEHFAAREGNQLALVYADTALTWSALAERVQRRAHGLKALGVEPGDIVTIALPNGTAFLETTYATLRLGATPNPVSSKMPMAELKAIVELAKPKVIVGVDSDAWPGWRTVGPEWTGETSDADLAEDIAPYWKAMTSGGSTGRPKLIVARSPGSVDLDAPNPLIGVGSEFRCSMVPGPLYHNGPFSTAMMSLNQGRRVVGQLRFDPEETLRLIAEHRADWLYQVPTMMSRIWALPKDVRERYDVSSLQRVLHLAAPCPPWLKEAWIDWLGADRVWELYGGTEAQGFTLISGSEWLAHRGSVGRFFNATVKILDDAGNELPAGEIGEVFMLPATGAGSTYHYVGATAKKHGDYESLGDMGWLDADGYLYLADRRTDLILRGGANIYPAEVEAAIDEHPDVASSVVIGLPHPDLGAEVHAIVQLKPGTAGTTDEVALKAFLKERLASYKVPSSFEFVNDFLRDDAGKVRRAALRAERIATREAARH
ncbi:MAG: AMP-binding protein [Alphaproteobacteria bacterium]|nr:AMP-binding protein [Alphaproteobacteria bacterium]